MIRYDLKHDNWKQLAEIERLNGWDREMDELYKPRRSYERAKVFAIAVALVAIVIEFVIWV